MRRKLQKMLNLAELQVEFEYRRFSYMLQSKSDKAAMHKANLLSIYIEFLTEKLNTLKKEL